MLVALVAVAGVVSLTTLGGAERDAIAPGVGDGPPPRTASLRSPPRVTASRSIDPGSSTAAVSVQAGVADIIWHVDEAAELLEEARRARNVKWAEPRFAFGDPKNAIQFSLELEGAGGEIGAVYRPKEIRESRWAAKDPDAQAAYLERTRVDEVDGRDTWDGLILRRDVPYPLVRKLERDVDARWETKTRGFVRTLDELFAQASYLEEEVGTGGFHWHVSFDRDLEHADALEQYWRHADEYLRLQMITEGPDTVVSPYVKPPDPGEIDDVRETFRDAEYYGSKFHPIGVRTHLYGNDRRIGFEVRSVNYDLERAGRVLNATVATLEDPKHASFAFTRGARRRGLSSLRGVDYENGVARMPRGRADALEDSTMMSPDWYALPYRDWKATRRWVTTDQATLDAARARYDRAIVERLRIRGRIEEPEIGALLHRWATETGIAATY